MKEPADDASIVDTPQANSSDEDHRGTARSSPDTRPPARWPAAGERLEMLEEAVDVMRRLWDGGFVNHRGTHFTVEQARVCTRPETPPRVYVSAFGPKALDLAGRVADGYILTAPDGDLVKGFRDAGGGDKPVQGGFKASWASTEDEAVATAHRLWANSGLPGELSPPSLRPVLRIPGRAEERVFGPPGRRTTQTTVERR